MYFQDLSSFFAMGGHGPFVWSAYGCALLVIIYNVWAPVMARKKLTVQLRRQQQLLASQQRNVRSVLVPSADLSSTVSTIQTRSHEVAGEKGSL